MVTVLFLLALISFALMGVFLLVLTARHRRRQQVDMGSSQSSASQPRDDRLG